MISKKEIVLKFCLVCTIILENDGNVLVLEIKLLIIRFIVLLTSCLIPKMSSISALIRSINFTNIETFRLLCHIFYTELIVLPRIFDVLCYFSLFPCRIIYSN
jgi:hypothetical protein